MCDPISATIGAAVIGAGSSAYKAKKAKKAQKRAIASSEAQAAREAQRAETEYNKANQRTPDLASILSGAGALSSKGLGATFLTGSKGVNPAQLPLGGTTLLGG